MHESDFFQDTFPHSGQTELLDALRAAQIPVTHFAQHLNTSYYRARRMLDGELDLTFPEACAAMQLLGRSYRGLQHQMEIEPKILRARTPYKRGRAAARQSIPAARARRLDSIEDRIDAVRHQLLAKMPFTLPAGGNLTQYVRTMMERLPHNTGTASVLVQYARGVQVALARAVVKSIGSDPALHHALDRYAREHTDAFRTRYDLMVQFAGIDHPHNAVEVLAEARDGA